MHYPSATHIGEGKSLVVLEEFRRKWSGLEVVFRKDDISKPTDWQIYDRRHAVIVHLGGHMHRLETELDSFGGSCGSALPGEVWTASAERKYASHTLAEGLATSLRARDSIARRLPRAGHVNNGRP